MEVKAKRYSFEDMLDEKGYLVYTIVGASMMPLLRQRRDLIEIHKKGLGRCHKYDVVMYRRGKNYILHRILRVLPNGYLIAGDNCYIVEDDITDDDILGVMKRVIRDGKDITMDNSIYRLYVHLWCDCYPLRMFLLRSKALLRRHLRKLLKIATPNR